MSQDNSTRYHHITLEERIKISCLLDQGCSVTYIARYLERNKSTISREIRNNGKPDCNKKTRVNKPKALRIDARHFRGQRAVETLRATRERYYERKNQFERQKPTYRAKRANQIARDRRSKAMKLSRGLILEDNRYQWFQELIIELLEIRWSPEQISIRLSLLRFLMIVIGIPPLLPNISHETIYAFVYRHSELKTHLRRRGKRYRRKRTAIAFNATDRTGHNIKDRPEVAECKERAGDLEGDTIFGKNERNRILTHYDRTTKVGSMSRVLNFNAVKISEQTIRDIERVFGKVYTITYDNGSEFTWWDTTEWKLGAVIYFADPYSPWQRPGNENYNGLVRDFFPKGTDLTRVSDRDILRVETLLNNRPRKTLCGFTPLEFSELLHLVI